MYVYTCFDVEDIVHPDSDDIARDIAEMLAADGVIASMFVVGEKARLWERRRRWDVISAVARHDVGLHTDHHSIHPTVSEYLAEREWADGVAEATRVEEPAAHDLARIFGAYPTSWATSGSSWAPQIPAATRQFGIPANVYAHAHAGESGACWYGGQLCYSDYVFFPGNEDAYARDETFEAGLPGLLEQVAAARDRGTRVLGLFGAHPTRLRYSVFWDALNYLAGVNTEPDAYRHAPRKSDAEYATGLRNLRRMIGAVGAMPGVRLVPVRAVAPRVAPQNGRVSAAAGGRAGHAGVADGRCPGGRPARFARADARPAGAGGGGAGGARDSGLRFPALAGGAWAGGACVRIDADGEALRRRSGRVVPRGGDACGPVRSIAVSAACGGGRARPGGPAAARGRTVSGVHAG